MRASEVHEAEGYSIRPAEPGDEPGILVCAQAAGDTTLTPERWRWRYRDNPAGTQAWVAAREADGAIHAHFAALPARAWWDGRATTFARITDPLLHPQADGQLEPSLLLRTAWPFFARHGGLEGDLVVFGNPTYPEFLFGHEHLRYEMVRTESVLFLPEERMAGALTDLPALDVTVSERAPEGTGALFERMRDAWGASIVRDAAHLNWRFADHPEHEYVMASVPHTGDDIRALVVLRRGDWMAPGRTILVDWLCPPDDDEAGLSLARWAIERARSYGSPYLGGWLPEWNAWFSRLQDFGFLVGPSEAFTMARNFHPSCSMDWLLNNWFYTLGDTDLV